ncbi:hypothetical protein [Enterovibrio nigricans]|uniref:Uncharacterized protein n=1 Tax=Enterovibrio nigricans DSM 22720 TaxID=1121868 RepID=A0A1T4VJ71_9GAMM|nr:hypothetical protein [Enterovibrio nigricans]PKF49724.1 hypothetical protein AT251_16765 [Enterovibrio nigricans]SKA64963.1 hypothetical protein SAMN02745132_03905 [Enterovibrio nigricans DSM 22720]
MDSIAIKKLKKLGNDLSELDELTRRYFASFMKEIVVPFSKSDVERSLENMDKATKQVMVQFKYLKPDHCFYGHVVPYHMVVVVVDYSESEKKNLAIPIWDDEELSVFKTKVLLSLKRSLNQ